MSLGQLIGDPLELEMFKSTRWILVSVVAFRIYVGSFKYVYLNRRNQALILADTMSWPL